jgi:hypothetical protein
MFLHPDPEKRVFARLPASVALQAGMTNAKRRAAGNPDRRIAFVIETKA